MRSEISSEEVDRFDWVGRSSIGEAACLTFVRGNEIPPVAEAFGAVVGQTQRFDFDEFCEESFALQETYSLIGMRGLGDWLLVVEDNGFQGSRPEVLRRVSVGTEATSAFWNVNGLTEFSYAVDGEVRTAFEALMPEYRHGTRPDALEEIRSDLPWSDHDGRRANTVSLMLALSARITGEALKPEAFEGEFLTFPIAEWPVDLPSRPETVRVDIGSDELSEALRAAGPGGCLRAASTVARNVLEHAEWLEPPVVSETLSALESGRAADVAAIGEAVREWNWQLRTHRATSKVRNQVRATEVLRQATNPDPYVAALAALHHARMVRGISIDELEAAALAAVRTAQWDA